MSRRGSLLPDDPETEETIFGVVIGLVTNVTDDPLQLNRVMVEFPTLQVSSAWARVCSFAAGPNRGAFFLPKVDDEVLIAFESGDVSSPYVIGALWNGVDPPPVAAEETQTVSQIQTASGAYLQFKDSDDGSGMSITLTDANGNQLVINTEDNSITLTSTGNITLQAQGKLTLTAASSVEIAAQGGSLTLSASSNAALLANGEVTVTGSVIRLN